MRNVLAKVPKGSAEMVAAPDITAFACFPQSHWRRLWTTNPFERVNGEIKRRADVVGIFPDEAAILRLVGAVLIETHDEWQVIERRYFPEGSMAAINPAAGPSTTSEPQPALLAS
jgi:transposase-like protein